MKYRTFTRPEFVDLGGAYGTAAAVYKRVPVTLCLEHVVAFGPASRGGKNVLIQLSGGYAVEVIEPYEEVRQSIFDEDW